MKQRYIYFVVMIFMMSISSARAQQGTALAKIRIDEKGNVEVLQLETNAPDIKAESNQLLNSLESGTSPSGTVQDSLISPAVQTASSDNHSLAKPMSPGPDLTYVQANCNMSYSYPNLSINARIINQGDVYAPASIIGYYLVDYGGSSIEQIGSDNVLKLDPGSYSDESITVNISKYVGNWAIRFIIDDLNSVSEDNESNNTKTFLYQTISVPLLIGAGPDLTYVSAFCNLAYFSGGSGAPLIYPQARIINIGKAPVNIKTRIGYYLSEDSHITTSDHLIAKDVLPTLNPGCYSNESITADISDYVGTWRLGFIIDYENSLSENNELNNVKTLSGTIDMFPDLIIDYVNITDASGPKIGYQYVTQNIDYASTGTGFKNYIYLSSDNTITPSDHKINEQQISTLGYNEKTNSGVLQTRVSGVPAGKYYLGVFTDAEDVISESDENNNTNYDNTPQVTIPQPPATQPDLIVQEVTVSEDSGPDIAYQYTVKNQGNASTGDGFTNHVYLSPDNTITTSDYQIDEQEFSALGSSKEQDSGALQTTISGVPAGDYYLGVYADGESEIAESKENNNTGYAEDMVNVSEESQEPDSCPDNMITNGSFSDSLENWQFFWGGTGVAAGLVENGVFHAQITSGGDYFHEVTLHQYGLTIINGNTYTATFEAKADSERTINVWVSMIEEPWSLYNSDYVFPLTTDWQTFTFTFTMTYPTDSLARFGIDFGTADPDVYLDNICLAPTTLDLKVKNVTVTNGTGPTIEYQYTLQNQGDVVLGVGFKNQIYLSSDSTITSSDYQIDEQQCSVVLEAGAEYNSGALLTSVRGVPQGDYYLGMYTDGEEVISESDENNNTGHAESLVTIPEFIEESDSCQGNMISNGSFFDGMENWQFLWGGAGVADCFIENGVFHALITSGGDYFHEVTLHQYGLTLVNGNTYTATFDARTDSSRSINVWVSMTEEPWSLYNSDYVFPLTTDWQTFTFTFTMDYPTDPLARLGVDFGTADPDVYLDNICLVEQASSTDITDEPSSLPQDFRLFQNFPNPFNPVTTIRYAVPKTCFVSIKIFDLTGREITSLVNEKQTSGVYSVQWYGQDLTSGIYFCRLRAGGFIETKKLMLLK